MASSMTNRHLAPEIYAASRRMKGKDTSTVVGDLQTKTYHDRHAQLNPHTVIGANLRQQEDANLFGRTAPVPGALSDMDDALPGARARPQAPPAAPSVVWQAAADAQGRTYYYNSAGQTSWTPPPDMQVPQWTAQRDPASGRTYYYNAATGQTSWGQQPQQQYNSLAGRFPSTFPG